WARYVAACLIVLPVAAGFRGGRVFPAERLAAHALRTAFLVIAMTLYFLAIARIPLATAASAYFVGPIVAFVLAAMVRKERLTLRKLLSLALGFVAASHPVLVDAGVRRPDILPRHGCVLRGQPHPLDRRVPAYRRLDARPAGLCRADRRRRD